MLSVLTVSLHSQDRKISGIINKYKRVTAIGPGINNVTLNDVTDVVAGDTVLLIQMKGSIIYIDETGSYGTYREPLGAPGLYEFMIVSSVDIANKVVVFTNPILNSYDLKGMVQLVTVPSYTSATVKGTLTCEPWDSIAKTGGVLTMIVGRTLSLEANIDVTGKGFYGGAISASPGVCSSTANYNNFSYVASYTNSGFKGEGHAILAYIDASNIPTLFPNYAKGMGNNFTSGGGGNGRYSGGGGGANYGLGGKGGREMSTCTGIIGDGGLGGKTIVTTDLEGKIFLGSGGGGTTYESTPTATSGGKGGGIIIILSETLKGKDKIISADGAAPAGTASGNAGAGGGGGGGTVALYQQSFSSPLDSSALTIVARGGKGGNTSNLYGEGGGGGGGFILTNNPPDPGNILKKVDGGAGGTKSLGAGNTGFAGVILNSFAPTLNGFLFNSIKSAVTGDLVDSICSNVSFGLILGTKPVGGVELPGGYHFQWQKSTAVAPIETDWVNAGGSDILQDYSPGTLTQTTWFRRVVSDNGAPVLVDKSTPILIIVQPFIKNNIIGTSDTICFRQDPPAFISKAVLQDGNGIYSFKWNVSLDNNIFSLPSNGYISESYTPPPSLDVTSWYRRTVTSGRCVDSSALVKITVLDTINSNRILNSPPDICFGTTFDNITATASPTLGGGDNTFRFKWESNINGAGWGIAPGTADGTGYDPGELPQRIPMNEYLFRRVVFSGSNDVCVSTSNAVILKDFPVLTNNTITSGQTICSGSIPSNLIGSAPLNGNGVYAYQWQDSSKAQPVWTIIPLATSIDFQPPSLTDTTRYRRIVTSSACTDVSKSIIVNVHKPLANFNIARLDGAVTDTVICNGQIPHSLAGTIATGGTNIAGSYIYQWKFSTDNVTYTAVASGGTGISYQPVALTTTTYFKREVTSGTCTEMSNPITVTVLPLISNNTISVAQTVCFNSAPLPLTGIQPTGGDGANYIYYWEQSSDGGTTWISAAGTNSSAGYSPPPLTIPMKYRRTVTSGLSGCCTNVSNIIDISQYPPLPTGRITNVADTTICGGSQVQLNIELTGTAPWKVTYKENVTDGPVTAVAANIATLSVTPASGSAVNLYSYSLGRVEDNNGCLAVPASLTGVKKANVYKIPTASVESDKTVCGSIVDLEAIPSVGTGAWIYPAAVVPSTPNGPKVSVTIDPAFAGKDTVHTFYWKETNWQCTDSAAVKITFDKIVTGIDAGPDTTLYSFDKIIHLTAKPVESWEEGLWSAESGSDSFDDKTANTTAYNDLIPGDNIFKWLVTNGTCDAFDLVTVKVLDIQIPSGFSPNNDGDNDLFAIRGLDLTNQIAELKVVNGAGAEVFSTSNINGQTWIDWDGKNSNGSDLPEGTYYYLLKLISKGNNQDIKLSGFIILKRY